MRQLHIAVDFDGTVVHSQWPGIGRLKFGAKWVLIWALRRGHKLVLCTCREGDLLKNALDYMWPHGIRFHAANENLPERIEKYGGDCRKISADLMVDDLAGFVFWPLVFLRILWFEMRR